MVQYPVACARPHEAVYIKDAQHERPHFCFGCHREMVIRRGVKKTIRSMKRPKRSSVRDSSMRLPQEKSTKSSTLASNVRFTSA